MVRRSARATVAGMKNGLVLLALAATAAVFAADLQTPWGAATWILYALPMFLLCYATGARHLYAFGETK